jgi:drug/metabolite transporter (DMT)-like permease
MQTKEFNGALAILVASALWGISYFLQKITAQQIDASLFVFFTILLGSLLLWTYYRFPPKRLWQHFLQDYQNYLSIAFIGGFLAPAAMMYGLQHIDLSIASMLERTQIIFVLFLAWWMLREHFAKEKYFYVIIAIISSYFITTKTPWSANFAESSSIGILAVLVAAFSWGFATIVSKKLSHTSATPGEITFIRFFLGSITALPFALHGGLLTTTAQLSNHMWLIIFLNALCAVVISYPLFYYGLQYTKANVTTFLEAIAPLIALLCGLVFLSESLVVSQIIAIPLFLFSVYKITTK